MSKNVYRSPLLCATLAKVSTQVVARVKRKIIGLFIVRFSHEVRSVHMKVYTTVGLSTQPKKAVLKWLLRETQIM